MHGYQIGSELIEGRICRDCPLTALICKDAKGQLYLVLGNIHIDMSVDWVAGLFVRSAAPFGGGPRRRSIRLFDRLGCRWALMSRSRLGDELAKRAVMIPRSDVAECWSCRDCSAIRLDVIDTEGRPFMVLLDVVPEELVPEWYAGLLFALNKPMGLPFPQAGEAPGEQGGGRSFGGQVAGPTTDAG
jgi:hypothetical protein